MDLIPYASELMTREQQLSLLWQRYQQRWLSRNDRMKRIHQVVTGDWTIFAGDDQVLDPKSPNLIQVALEDTAESAASYIPTIRVDASKTTKPAKEAASVMERLGAAYMAESEWPILALQSMEDLAAYGLFSWVVTWRTGCGPKIEYRDPRTCFPEPDMSTMTRVKRCFFARAVYATQLEPDWRAKFEAHLGSVDADRQYFVDNEVTLLEYYTDEGTVIAACYDANKVAMGGVTRLADQPDYVTIILEEFENPFECCQVVVGQRVTLDREPRGQFDQVISVLKAHFDLMATVIDYADEAVYSDIWVKDLIGEMATGGQSYIQLGPQGAIGRVEPAVTSFSLFNEMQQLLDSVHLGSRYPKARPGEVDQNIVSGKGLETMVGTMNTVVSTFQTIMQRALEQALRVCFKADKLCGEARTVSGKHKNRYFHFDRKADDIDLDAPVRVVYGVGLGKTDAEATVVAIQRMQSGFESMETLQETLSGIDDVDRERRRLDVQQFRDMALAKMLQGLQDGTIPDSTLIKIAKEREDGADLFDLFNKHIVLPKEEQQAQMIPSALSGEQMMPGEAPAAGGGGVAPPAPSPDELLGLLGGGMAREEPQAVARNSVNLGGGSFAGVESRS